MSALNDQEVGSWRNTAASSRTTIDTTMQKLIRGEYFSLFLLIAINMLIGIKTLSDYGESWDEATLYQYVEQSLNAYRSLLNPDVPVDYGDGDLRFYGPAYFMGMSLVVQVLQRSFPQVSVIELWHIGNFACLQLGLLFLYLLLRRYLHSLSSFAAVALFASQPLIWGHGFINPKDIPFMTCFTGSVFFGLKMLDQFEKHNFELRSLFRNPWFYAAVIALGVAISVRILGFAAAGIVLFYFASIHVRKVLRLSYAYIGGGLLVTFLTWPFLWSSPVSNFLTSVYAMLKFQWVGYTLFQGVYYPSNELPRSYVPRILSMQLTETALILFGVGLLSLFAVRVRKDYKDLFILFLVWFVFPVLYILISGMNLYDNARQLLFIFPAMFLVMAVGLDLILASTKPIWARTVLVAIVLLPGIAGMLRYHPYEYTYYNFFTTSTQQIDENYETDYWLTSYKQVARYLNEHAPQNAQVIVWGPGHAVRRYARTDLVVRSFDEVQDDSYTLQPYYLVLPTRYNMDEAFFSDIQPVYSVQLNGAVLAVIRYITP